MLFLMPNNSVKALKAIRLVINLLTISVTVIIITATSKKISNAVLPNLFSTKLPVPKLIQHITPLPLAHCDYAQIFLTQQSLAI